MALTSAELMSRMREFTVSTLDWCSKESESSTTKVTDAIDLIIQKMAQVSAISDESRTAMEGIQSAISRHLEKASESTVMDLIQSLEDIAEGHREMGNFLKPILNALQFQDRLHQNLQNMLRMLTVWLDLRQKMPAQLSPEERQAFGRELMKFTTMISERNIIRDVIPGLEPEQAPDAVTLF